MSLVGRLEDLALADIFQILSVGKKTGTLIIKSGEHSALVVFKNGLVVRAEGNLHDKQIGEELMNVGLLKSESILKMATDVKKDLPGKSLTDILVEFGALKKETMEKFTRKRIEKLAARLINLEEGSFQFELDDLKLNGKLDVDDYGWELSRGLSPEYLLMEGARVHDESSSGMYIEEEIYEDEQAESGWEDDWSDLAEEPEKEMRDYSHLRALTQELRFPSSTSEITLLILRFASEIFQRGVFFMVGDDEIIGLGQFGLEIEGADDTIRRTRLSIAESTFIKDIIEEGRMYTGILEHDSVTESMMDIFGGIWPAKAAIFPLFAEEKVVALLYCDNLEDDQDIEAGGLEIFISQAGLALEKALLKRRLGELENRN